MRNKLTEHHRSHVRDLLATLKLVQIALVVQKKLPVDVPRTRQFVAANAIPDRVNLVVVKRLLKAAVSRVAGTLRRFPRVISCTINRPIRRIRQIHHLRHNLRLQKAVRVVLEKRRNVSVIVVVLDLIVEKRRGLSIEMKPLKIKTLPDVPHITCKLPPSSNAR